MAESKQGGGREELDNMEGWDSLVEDEWLNDIFTGLWRREREKEIYKQQQQAPTRVTAQTC